jgi:hypothetical protein
VLSLVVDLVIAYFKFPEGAWMIVIFVPMMVIFLVRLARQYEREAHHLDVNVPAAVQAAVMRRLVVLCFIDRLDLASARAIQFGRALSPSELRAVHFVIDDQRAEELSAAWREHGLANIPLELVDCPDRRLTHSALTTVAQSLADGRSEVCVVVAERRYGGFWRRILHDQTADALARDISRLPHANVTTVPFHLGKGVEVSTNGTEISLPPAQPTAGAPLRRSSSNGAHHRDGVPVEREDGSTTIAAVRWRQHVKISGRVGAVKVQPVAGVGALECSLTDETAAISVVFFGRRRIEGIGIGTRMSVEGIVIEHHGRLAIVNPVYRLDA